MGGEEMERMKAGKGNRETEGESTRCVLIRVGRVCTPCLRQIRLTGE